MASPKRITVVGGGLAGLAAAIAAARRGYAVDLCESHAYGRDKVCGEFLSPEVRTDFEALGCGDFIDALGPVPMRDVALIADTGGRHRRIDLRIVGPSGLSISRRVLEAWLCERARAAGVVVRERAPVRSLSPRRGTWTLRVGDAELEAHAVICAFGKRSSLDAPLGLPRAAAPESFAGIKAYFPDAGLLEADVELYLVPGGYVGLNAVEGGRIGVCALLEGKSVPRIRSWDALRNHFSASPALARKLDRMGSPLGPVRGLARFGFGAQTLARIDTAGSEAPSPLLFCGDAARMIPSFTGDGMAIALRSGRLAAAALGERDAAAAYRRAYEAEFSRRLRFAAALHRVFLRPEAFRLLAPLAARAPRLVDKLYALTRG